MMITPWDKPHVRRLDDFCAASPAQRALRRAPSGRVEISYEGVRHALRSASRVIDLYVSYDQKWQ